MKLRIAVATNGKNGLEDVVSNVFGRADTFTIVDTEDEKVTGVTTLENTAATYHHGAGPITVKTLADANVKLVIANELGVGASELLKQLDIEVVAIKPGTNVSESVKKALRTRKQNTTT